MNRSSSLLVIAIALAGYGLYAASFVPAMFVVTPMPLLLIGFLLQAIFGFVAAFGVWRGAGWAGTAAVLLGVSIAITWLCEAFILGLVGYLYALLVSAIALIVTFAIAAYVKRQGSVASR